MNTKIPAWFSPHSPPVQYSSVPEKELVEYKRTDEVVSVTDGGIIEETDDWVKVIDLDYSGVCYEGETPSFTITKCLKIKKPNKQYEHQMEVYQQDEELFKQRLEEWPKLKMLWDEKVLRNAEMGERRILAKLKKKYEK